MVELGSQIYLDSLHAVDTEQSTLGQVAGVKIASAARSDGRPELAEQVARAAWDAYGDKDAKYPLPVALIYSMLANGKVHDAIRFLQYEVPADSDYASGYDYNSDGHITSTEKLWPWDPKNYTQLDKDLDGSITEGETGEAMWSFFADADQNEDHSIDLLERFYAVRSAYFVQQDGDRDGQLSTDEWSNGSFDRFDADGDGKVSQAEFVEIPPLGTDDIVSPLSSGLIATMLANGRFDAIVRFVQHELPADSGWFHQRDYNSDGEITSTELPSFWKSRTRLDKNSDRLITPDEVGEAGWNFLADADQDQDGSIDWRERFLASHIASFVRYDVDCDRALSKDEWTSRSYYRFDADGDRHVSWTEFVDSPPISPTAFFSDPLPRSLIATTLANEGLDGVVRLVQRELPADSDLFHQRDFNSDGQLTSNEVPAFWHPATWATLDKNSDNSITPDETGQTAWSFVADADQDEDGAIEFRESGRASRFSSFAYRDLDRDSQLSKDEWPSGPFDRFDVNRDGYLTMAEFVDSLPSGPGGIGFAPFAPTLTPEEKFANNDLDGDGQVTLNEADEEFWNSIAKFDGNGDKVVDREELQAGLREEAVATSRRLHAWSDTNNDGQLSPEEVGKPWKKYGSSDSNGDGLLNEQEFVNATVTKNAALPSSEN